MQPFLDVFGQIRTRTLGKLGQNLAAVNLLHNDASAFCGTFYRSELGRAGVRNMHAVNLGEINGPPPCGLTRRTNSDSGNMIQDSVWRIEPNLYA